MTNSINCEHCSEATVKNIFWLVLVTQMVIDLAFKILGFPRILLFLVAEAKLLHETDNIYTAKRAKRVRKHILI